MNVKIEKTWQEKLQVEFAKDYFKDLTRFIKNEYLNKVVYPPPKNIFQAFNLCPFNKVKVIIIGQDPYHGPQQAHGLAFSVRSGVSKPPSLINIFKELSNDLNIPIRKNSDLSSWTEQGVLLLNATLSVRANQAGSHQHKGWEQFTDAIISLLSQEKEHLVFILWGAYAQSKEELVDHRKHLILKAPHPSPLSVFRGFFGCHHFSKTNNYLIKHSIIPINWSK